MQRDTQHFYLFYSVSFDTKFILFSMLIIVDVLPYLMLFINIRWEFIVAWLDKMRVVFVKRIHTEDRFMDCPV